MSEKKVEQEQMSETSNITTNAPPVENQDLQQQKKTPHRKTPKHVKKLQDETADYLARNGFIVRFR